jgi:peptide deformylase
MIYPIVVYGDPVLKKKAQPIENNYPKLDKLIEDMFETMYASNGVGLAAPQIDKSIRLFVVDGSPMAEDDENEPVDLKLKDFKKVFINPEIIEETGTKWTFEEGCLSIPGIREKIDRQGFIKIKYQDEHFKEHTETFDGLCARIIQHEYDHLEGVLFTDKISAFKRSMLKGKLNKITLGDVKAGYPIKIPKKK